MVSINGVSLKKEKLVYVYGVDVLTADVYLDGKKLGNWCEDADGGEDRFDFNEKLLKSAMDAYKNSLPDGYIYKKAMGFNVFLNEIHNLNDLRKTLRKHWKENPNTHIVVVSNGFSNGIISYYDNCREEELNTKIDEMRNELKSEKNLGFDNLGCVIRHYDSEEDFVFNF